MSYAGDLTPQQTWELLRDNAAAVLVDVRTDAEWRYVGVPELGDLGKQVVFVEWQAYPSGEVNPQFVDQLRAAGVTDASQVAFLCRSGQRSASAAEVATAAGVAKAYNVIDGFEGGLDGRGHRGHRGWRALGLPWRQF